MTIGNVNEQGYHFWLVMFTDWMYNFSDVNEKVYFSDVDKLGKWQLVMSMNRDFCFELVMLMDREYPLKWCQWKRQSLSIGDVRATKGVRAYPWILT
jgi:hypothetical protein